MHQNSVSFKRGKLYAQESFATLLLFYWPKWRIK